MKKVKGIVTALTISALVIGCVGYFWTSINLPENGTTIGMVNTLEDPNPIRD